LEDTPAALEGLGKLAKAYWRPLYVFLRRRGRDHSSAEDAVQGFFADLLSREFFVYVKPELGRFRSFMLASLERWLSKQAQHDNRLKRGGDWRRIELDATHEGGDLLEDLSNEDPGRAFDRQWAVEVVDRAVVRLRQAYHSRGRGEMFDQLRGALPGGATLPAYEELSAATGIAEASLRKAVHDLRARFAEAIRQEIACTVQDPAEVEDEVRYLASLLRG
jgi:RNA polymerase sigma-70 factor (ECF subfamily)